MKDKYKMTVVAASLMWLFAIVPGNAQNELRPIYEKSSPRIPNFELEIIGGFSNNSGEIDHGSTTEFDMATGHQTGGENSTGESIRERNAGKEYFRGAERRIRQKPRCVALLRHQFINGNH